MVRKETYNDSLYLLFTESDTYEYAEKYGRDPEWDQRLIFQDILEDELTEEEWEEYDYIEDDKGIASYYNVDHALVLHRIKREEEE